MGEPEPRYPVTSLGAEPELVAGSLTRRLLVPRLPVVGAVIVTVSLDAAGLVVATEVHVVGVPVAGRLSGLSPAALLARTRMV